MTKISNILCEYAIATFCSFIFCCSCLCTDSYYVVGHENDHNDECKYKLNVDAFAHRNHRPTMEDRYFIDETTNDTDIAVFAVFDGHGGNYVAAKARSQLMPRIRNKIQEIVQIISTGISSATTIVEFSAQYYVEKFGIGDTSLVPALKQMLYDEIMQFDERMQLLPQNNFCGSTAVIAILTGHHLIVANVGDSRAILGNKSNMAIRITKDHKPDDKDERARIESVPNGKVTIRPFDVPRVNHVLAMSRALGDTALKKKQFIIATPDMFVIDLNEPRYHPKYLVIASDGIWDVLDDQEVIDLINESANTESVAKQIAQDAIHWYSHDNIAILIISFDVKVTPVNKEEGADADDGIVEDDDDGDGVVKNVESEVIPVGVEHNEL